MRAARLLFWFALIGAATPGLLLAPAPVYADDDDDDDYETLWIGARLGAWYRPTMNMDIQVNGIDTTNPLVELVGTDFDIKRDLGVRENVFSDYATDFDREAIPELEIFLESEWISFYFYLVPPYEYRGNRTLTQTIVFAGQTFSASTPVESTFEQFYAGVDVSFNLLNTRFLKVAPMIGLRAFGVDWEIKAPQLGIKADTTDIGSVLEFEDFQVIPYPEIGADVRVGYRDYVELGVKLSGAFIDFFDVEGNTYKADVFVNVYPIPWIGLTVGLRTMVFDIKHKRDAEDATSDPADDDESDFDFDLEYTGFYGGVTVRF